MYIVYVYIYIGGPSSGLYESRMFMLLAAAPQNLANIGSQFNDQPVACTLLNDSDPRPRKVTRFRNRNKVSIDERVRAKGLSRNICRWLNLIAFLGKYMYTYVELLLLIKRWFCVGIRSIMLEVKFREITERISEKFVSVIEFNRTRQVDVSRYRFI